MSKFKYKAMSSDGKRIEGTYEADSKQQVLDMISANGYSPLKIEELSVKNRSISFKIHKKVKLKDLSIFCRQFYTMLDAGVPMTNCLHILSTQLENEILKKAIMDIEDRVNTGATLSSAMKYHEDVFPELLVSLVEAGETSGNLDSIMLRMSTHYEKQYKMNNKIRNAMIYPIVLSIVAVVVLIVIMTFVLPTFTSIFEQSGTALPWSTRFLIRMSSAFRNHFIIIVIAIAVIGIAIKYFTKTEQGRVFTSSLKLKLPILKKLNQKIIVSRFTRTLSTLLSSGITLAQALPIVSSSLGNRIAQTAIEGVREKVIVGKMLNSSIKEAEIFPAMLSSMVKIGEESGSLDDILNKTADFYDEEVETQLQATVALMEPLLIVIMGFVIGFIIISIMLPMYDSYTQI